MDCAKKALIGSGLAAALLCMLMLPAGHATAEELALLDEDDDTLIPMDRDALDEANGGFVIQSSSTDQQTTFTDNPITVDNGGLINTGTISSSNMNSGGITTTMLNTGNNVSFQNSTTLNIYLDAAP